MASSTFSESLMSDETFDFVCTGCDKKNKTVQAVKYCVECKLYCCQSCTDMHGMFPLMADHSFLGVGQGKQHGNQTPNLPEFPTERCCIHSGKVQDMYCRKHDVVGCYVCMAKDHKSCPESQIYSLPDMVDVLYNPSDCQQTQRRLQQMIFSFSTLSKSKDAQLKGLKEAKEETINQTANYQKVLERIVRKAAESSKKKVVKAYTSLEADILQDKNTIDSTNDVLQETDDKLKKAFDNRAQRFVCLKEAEKNIKVAENEKLKQEKNDNTDVEISFRPNNTLMDYIQGVHGIGDVLVVAKKKRNLYEFKGRRDINIKVSDDNITCSSYGCCLTYDNQLLVTDYDNKKVKRIDTQTLTVVGYVTLDSSPQGICCINQHVVAVGCYSPHKIQFVSIKNKMTATRKIVTSHDCFGISMKDDNLFVTDFSTSLYIYDMNGTLLRTITNDDDGNKLFSKTTHIVFIESGNIMYVCDRDNGLVCFDGKDNYLSTIKDSDLKGARGVCGVCTDGRGNLFVHGFSSNTIEQYNEDGKKIGVVQLEDGSKYPTTIFFHRGQNRMFVTMYDSDILKMYELE
ncbi:hypothetical protein ACF0H5_021331 [Mactra antiquata]